MRPFRGRIAYLRLAVFQFESLSTIDIVIVVVFVIVIAIAKNRDWHKRSGLAAIA